MSNNTNHRGDSVGTNHVSQPFKKNIIKKVRTPEQIEAARERQKEREEEWRSEAMQFGGTSHSSDSLEDTTYNHADPRNR